MKQTRLDLNLSTKKTRKREFLEDMECVVPWLALVQIVEPLNPLAKTGRPSFAIETMLRIHYLQQWFALSDPAIEEALHDMPVFQKFAGLDDGVQRFPDDAGFQSVNKRAEAVGPTWHVAMKPGKRRLLHPFIWPDTVAERAEKAKASTRAKVKHPLRVLKRQFGFTKVRYRALAKNMAQIVTFFALSNLLMTRRKLVAATA